MTWVASFTLLPLYPRINKVPYLLDTWLGQTSVIHPLPVAHWSITPLPMHISSRGSQPFSPANTGTKCLDTASAVYRYVRAVSDCSRPPGWKPLTRDKIIFLHNCASYIHKYILEYTSPLAWKLFTIVKVKQSRYTPWRRLGGEEV
jgi:hypothetical protein